MTCRAGQKALLFFVSRVPQETHQKYGSNQKIGGNKMRYKKITLFLSAMLILSGVAVADTKWARSETTYKIQPVLVIEDKKEFNLMDIKPVEKPIREPQTIMPTPIEDLGGPLWALETKPIERSETIHEIVKKIAHKKMTEHDLWYLTEAILWLIQKRKAVQRMEKIQMARDLG